VSFASKLVRTRTSFAAASSIALALACPVGSLFGQSGPASWLQFRGDTTNAGYIAGDLAVSWSYRAAHTVRGLSVADGIVVIGSESAQGETDAALPERDGEIAALDVATGRALWRRTLPSWIHGDPAIAGGLVLAALGRVPFDSAGALLAFDARTGAPVWSFPTRRATMPAPAVDAATGTVTIVGADGIAYVVSLASGALVHSVSLDGVDAMSSPRVAGNGVVYVGSGSSLNALSARTGRALWASRQAPLTTLMDPPAALSADLVFITGVQGLGVREAARAATMRDFIPRLLAAAWREPLAKHRSWFRQQWLLAVDRRSGRLAWRRPLGVGFNVERNESGTPVVAGDRVIVSSPISGRVSAFDVRTGLPQWKYRTAAMHKGAVTVVGDDVLFGDNQGFLNVLHLRDGTFAGRCRAGAPFTVLAPVVVGQTIFAATKGGWVTARPYAAVRATMTASGSRPCFIPLPAAS
jgi:outer membrane protein assembly factor BamB